LYSCGSQITKGVTHVTTQYANSAVLPMSHRTSPPNTTGFIMRVLVGYSIDENLRGGEISFTLTLELLSKSGWDVLAALPTSGHLSVYLQERGNPLVKLPQPAMRGNLVVFSARQEKQLPSGSDDRKVSVGVVVGVEECQLLSPMRRIVGGIQVDCN